MKMGEYIRYLRCGNNVYGKKWTQEELGKLLVPTVERQAINKWEKGLVVNIKRDYIIQMSKLFGVHPSELMSFSEEDELSIYAEQTQELLENFDKLNDLGRKKVLSDVSEMTKNQEYKK